MALKSWVAAGLAACLVACGGGGGGGGGGTGAGGGTPAPEPAASNLALSASFGDALVPAGGTTTLTITVTNNGAGPARGVELSAEWAVGFAADPDFTCSATGGATCPPPIGSGEVPDIPPGGRLVFVAPVTLAADARGAITSTLMADALNESQPADNVTLAIVHAYRADVSVSGRGPSTPVQAGTTATYTMTVLNAGPDEARNVSIQNTLGPSQIAGTMSCAAGGGAVCPAVGASMAVPRLPANGSLVFTLPVQVAAGTSGSVRDTMTVSSAGDAVPGNNTAAVQISTYVAPRAGQTSVLLQSDVNDYIGGGLTYSYTRADSVLSFTPNGGSLVVTVAGDQRWGGEFQLPSGVTQFVPGTYMNLTRAALRDPAVGGLDWAGEGRGCNTLSGSITVNSASYSAANVLDALDLSFEQHCEGVSAALRGHVVWVASDATTPPGPIDPPPSTLWAPAPTATPSSGSYVHLQSDAGDFIGSGRSYTYTKADALLSVAVSGTKVTVNVGGDQNWTGDFITMNTLTQLQPGYYPGLMRYPFHNPVKGGLSWDGEGRGCNKLTGWMVVDGVTWNGSSLATLDLRFEQHCEGLAPALHGKIHWDANDTTAPPGPVTPIPATLWAPPSGATPASGNYVYLASDPGDYIGQGVISTTTTLSTFTGPGQVNVAGGGWTGVFQAMDSLAQLQVGYYGNLSRYPFHNHVRGGLDWSGNGRGCNTLQGWFAVDSVSYDASGLAAIDLRFEQHCESATAALRGKVHWVRP